MRSVVAEGVETEAQRKASSRSESDSLTTASTDGARVGETRQLGRTRAA